MKILNKYLQKSLFALFTTVIIASFALTACHEGPAEKKGKSIDKVVDNVRDKISNKGPAQKAGEKLDDATGN
jgi:ABC-type transporter MlaC component